MDTQTLHQHQPVIQRGASLDTASAAMIMIHGRGAAAHHILDVSSQFPREDIAYLAPQAYGNSWYPYSFLAPREKNEPGLSDALGTINAIVDTLIAHSFTTEQIFLLGFSQGACLALEYTIANPAKYAGIFGLSGGLIGPHVSSDQYEGQFYDTPVFLGCSDIDPHIPKQRVLDTERIFSEFGASVTMNLYPNMGHYVNDEELQIIGDRLLAF